jgi:PAS domain S-box-containing protein
VTPRDRGFEALFTAALDAVLVVDDARTFVDANPAACRLLGLPCDGLVGRRFDEFLAAPGNLDAAWDTFLRAGQQTGELHVIRADGMARDVEYSATANAMPRRHLAILRDITERKQAEAGRVASLLREQERLRETGTLLAVSRALSATLDPTETMRRVAREIALALGADMVGAYLADPAGEQLWPVAGYRVPRDRLDEFRRFPIPITDHPAIEEAWTHRRAVWTDDMAGDPRVHRRSYERFPHQTDLFVPIRVKDRPVGGFFAIWWTARRPITGDEIRLLQGISDLAGISLENAQLYREAAEANRAKDEFLAMLSHELRNPLGAIATAVATLERVDPGGPPATRLREIIGRQTHRLARLVDDLLDVAKATAGKIALDAQPVDLGELAGACVRALLESGRGAAHRVTIAAGRAIVHGDAARLEQVVTNLLENAVKYTPPGGAIDVEVRPEGPHAVLRVSDSGRGIAPDMLLRIFDAFAQARQAMDRSLGGLGVGLTLARRLVEVHGGTIEASSEGEGRGARFTVRLPLNSAEVAAPPPETARPTRGRRTLIIEDNDDARDALRTLLELQGHQVLAAGDGDRGVALALAERPDVVLIDLGLPGIDGYEVARAIRAHAAGKAAVLIAITGYGQAEDRRRTQEAGFDAHLMKPVSLAALANLIGGAA